MRMNPSSRPQAYTVGACLAPRLFSRIARRPRTPTWRRGAAILPAWFAIAVVGCHDSPVSTPRSLAPSENPVRSAGLITADPDWDTYSAVVTIHQAGAQFKSAATDDASFRVTRVLQPDSSWRTTIALAGRGSIGRTEIASHVIHSYDGAGREVVRGGPDLSSGPPPVRA